MREEHIDLVVLMMSFESGDLSTEGVIKLFSNLIKTGMVWTLQGFYGRTAKQLIENGFLTTEGEPTKEALSIIKRE